MDRHFFNFIFIALLCFSGKVWAEDYGVISFSTTYNASITSSNTLDSYTVVLPMPGSLELSITSPGGTAALPDYMADVRWIDASNNVVLRTTSGGFTFPHNDNMDVDAGIYIIEMVQRPGLAGNTGNYSMRMDCFVDEVEPNNTNENAQFLPHGYTVRGTIASSDVDMYQYVLTEPGRMTVNFIKGTLYGWVYIRWYDANGVQIKSATPYGSDSYTGYMDVEAGTYYIGIIQDGNTGTYNLRMDFAYAGNNEIEPNNTTTNAQTLTSGQTVKGFLSYQDDTDMYQFILTKPGKMTVNFTKGTLYGWVYIRWYDANGVQIKSATPYGSDSYTGYMDLEAGTYYIGIIQDGITGTYNLRVDFAHAGNNEIEPNESRVNAQFLESGQTVKGFLSYQDDTDMYRYVLTEQGRMTVNFTKETLYGWVYIRWYDADGVQIKSATPYGSDSYTGYMDLDAGTYYIGIIQDGITGTYNLTIYTGTAPTTSVTGVNVAPANVSTQRGFTQTFTATVTGINVGSSQEVTWTVTGSSNSETTISTSGALTIAPDETATSLTVIATSTVNTSMSGTANVTVTSPPVIITQPSDGVVKAEGNLDLSVTATGAFPLTYQWYRATNPNNNGGTTVGTNSPTFSVPTTIAGTFYYYVTIFNSDGSVTSRPATVTVIGDVGIWQLTNTNNSFIVYPNPARDILHVKLSSDKELDYTIYNVAGHAVKKGTFHESEAINVDTLPSGVYWLHTEEGVGRFVKQ